jgi:AraC-like DNA-binding protein
MEHGSGTCRNQLDLCLILQERILSRPTAFNDNMDRGLADAILAYTDSQPSTTAGEFETPVPGLVLFRNSRKTPLEHAYYDPALILIVQGSKEVSFGSQRSRYAAGQYLVLSVGMPVSASVTEASDEMPYLALSLKIDLLVINELTAAVGSNPDISAEPAEQITLSIHTLSEHQAASMSRLAELLSMPEALRVLYPSLAREIMYWTLSGPDSGELRRLATPGSHTQRIAESIIAMRHDFCAELSIERLAAIANMSISSYHRHFKAVTTMSPLQYQKQLRLIEARRLMVTSGADVAQAAYHVGYESSSQFSREYSRLFGAPPRRDVLTFRLH